MPFLFLFWTACFVVDCGGGLAYDVINTIGQAFEIRFKMFLQNPPLATEVPERWGDIYIWKCIAKYMWALKNDRFISFFCTIFRMKVRARCIFNFFYGNCRVLLTCWTKLPHCLFWIYCQSNEQATLCDWLCLFVQVFWVNIWRGRRPHLWNGVWTA